MNHLLRELAPVGDDAWQADRGRGHPLDHALPGRTAARRLRRAARMGPLGRRPRSRRRERRPAVRATCARRGGVVMPLIELRTPFSLSRAELDAAERGAADLDLDAVIDASRAIALAEDGMIFHGDAADGIEGIAAASPHDVVTIGDDYAHYPGYVANAVELLRVAGVGGPYAIALGPESYTGVTETTEPRWLPGVRAPPPDPGRIGAVGAGGRRRGRGEPSAAATTSSPSARTSRSGTRPRTPSRSSCTSRRAWPSPSTRPKPPSTSPTGDGRFVRVGSSAIDRLEHGRLTRWVVVSSRSPRGSHRGSHCSCGGSSATSSRSCSTRSGRASSAS